MMHKSLKIGLGQLKFKDGDIVKNKKLIENIIQESSSKDVDIICFPELTLTGYNFDTIKDVQTCNIIKVFFSTLAKNYNIGIVAGIPDFRNGKFYDSAAVWDNKGNMIYEYDKIHLWSIERDFFEKGSNINVVEFKGWKIGIAICADVGFPEVSRILTLRNAEVLIFISEWASPYDDLWTLMLRARAAENQVYVLGVNRIGEGNYSDYCGCSMIIDPKGDIVQQLGTTETGLLIYTINNENIIERRKEIPWLNYRVPQVYSEIIKN